MQKIIVVKIGSSVLFTNRERLDEFRVSHLLDQMRILQERGYFVIFVISGAVAMGSTRVTHANRQVRASVGQALLIARLVALFSQKKLTIAQILLTRKDMKIHSEQLVHTLFEMMKEGIVPILNENDVIELNSFGGNDLLASRLAGIMRAQLVILSTRAGSQFGVGGGATKLEAVERLKKAGIPASIKNGKEHNCLLKGELI